MRITLVALAATACAALVAPIAATATEAPAAARQQETNVRMLDFNFAGNGFNGGSTGAPVTDAVRKVVDEQAEIVGLNEMCYTQWVAMRDQLKAEPGYEGLTEHVVVTNYNIPNCYDPVVNPGGWYVMGLFSKYDSDEVMFGDTPYLDLGYHYRQRYRKLVCGDVDIPGATVVRACVTHTEVPLPLINETSFPNDPDIADDPLYGRSINYAQAKVIAEAITPMADELPVALMGDLNELPFLPSLDFFYRRCGGRGVFEEVDGRDPRWPVIRRFNLGTEACPHRQGEWTMGAEGRPDVYDKPYESNRKIDYIFVDTRHFVVGPESGRVISTPFSDHRIVVGDVTLKH
ncbi:endonuclease/exonuclease/phosphatase family protein [Jiangella endophytica]|uniref:endonuclease/exonuclease/phosphatase family protein n=1 Tax=Jiangella endophytica TaxID=1623398 RepID=UPI000E349AAB|nr:endonuclease/exonuclease/phosphatase family protein [Jiangella endophytica]